MELIRPGSGVLASVLDRSPDLVLLSDFSTGRIKYLNPAGIRLLGLRDFDDACSRTTADFLSHVGAMTADEVESALALQGNWRGPTEVRSFRTGDTIPLVASVFVVEYNTDGPTVVAAIGHDQRRRRKDERHLRLALETAAYRAREQHALATLSTLAVAADLETVLESATAAAAALMGVHCASIARIDGGGGPLPVASYRGPAPVPSAFPRGTGSQVGYAAETGAVVVCTDRDSEKRYATMGMNRRGLHSGVSTPIGDAPVWGVLSAHSTRTHTFSDRDVSFLRAVAGVLAAAIRRIEVEQRLRHQSLHDPLTGLGNRAMATARIATALESARSAGTRVALLLVDLDDLKTINDTLGHAIGDRALVELARRLTATVRPTDAVARLGGDEFLVVCEDVPDERAATDTAERIIATLADFDPESVSTMGFSASIGIAVSDPHTSADALVERADLAMYRAKNSGAGRYAVYDESDSHDTERVLGLAADLRSALPRGDLFLVYEPVVDTARGAVVAVDAGIRWVHPAIGSVCPAEIAAVAERTGQGRALAAWALDRACSEAAQWQAVAPVAVRLAFGARQLADVRFPADVVDAATRAGLPIAMVGVGVTESASDLGGRDDVEDVLSRLHAAGVTLVLEGFGAADSTFARLRRNPQFDMVEIDPACTAELPDTRATAVVSALVTLARAFGVAVVAGGVTTQSQLDSLLDLGCTVVQGKHVAGPLTYDELVAFLAGDAVRAVAASRGR